MVVKLHGSHLALAVLAIGFAGPVAAARPRIDLDPHGRKLLPDVLDLTAKALAFQELGLMGRAQGLDLVPGRTVSTTTEYPNPFGGKSISCEESLELESSRAPPGRAVVVWRQASDLSSVLDSIEKLDERDGPRPGPGGSPGKSSIGHPKMTGRCRYVIDIATGLALEAQCTTEFQAELTGGQTQPLPRKKTGPGER